MSAFGAAIDEEADDEVRPNRAPSGRRGDKPARERREDVAPLFGVTGEKPGAKPLHLW